MSGDMVVILCDTWEEAQDAFDVFWTYVNDKEPWTIWRVYAPCLCLELDCNIRYLFTITKMVTFFEKFTLDIVDESSFFEALYAEDDDDNYIYGGMLHGGYKV